MTASYVIEYKYIFFFMFLQILKGITIQYEPKVVAMIKNKYQLLVYKLLKVPKNHKVFFNALCDGNSIQFKLFFLNSSLNIFYTMIWLLNSNVKVLAIRMCNTRYTLIVNDLKNISPVFIITLIYLYLLKPTLPLSIYFIWVM